MTTDGGVFTPESATFNNYVALITAAKAKTGSDKCLIVDMTKASEHFDSAAVCFLLELMRDSRSNKHSLEIRNIGGRLQKLLKLYQLDTLVAPSPALNQTTTA